MTIQPIKAAAGFFGNISRRYSTNDERTISRRNITVSNYASGLAGNLVGGSFFTGFMLLLNADDAFMGLVTMVSLIGNLLQILSPLLLERFQRRKIILICGRCVIYFFNIIIIGIIPFLHFTNKLKLMMVLIVILSINLVNAVMSPGFSVWQIKSIPENIRARYYSFFSITNGVIVYTAILAASQVVDRFKALDREMDGLMVFRAVALFICLIDIFFLFRIREYPNIRSDTAINLKNILLNPFREKRYLVTVLIACLWSFSANIPGPYFTIYMLKDLKVTYSYLNIVNMLYIPILIFLTPLWARRIQATSWFRTLYFSMSIYLIYYIGAAFVTKDTLILYPIAAIVSFIFSPGINLAFSNIPYINLPEKNQTNYIGFYNTMSNFAALIGVTVGKEFIGYTEHLTIDFFGVHMQNKQYINLLTGFMMLAAVVVIYILQKKEINKYCMTK